MNKKDDEGKVSLAVINTKLEYISKDITDIKETLEKINETSDNHSNRIASLETKTGIVAGLLSIFTIVASAIAAWMGMKN